MSKFEPIVTTVTDINLDLVSLTVNLRCKIKLNDIEMEAMVPNIKIGPEHITKETHSVLLDKHLKEFINGSY